MRSPARVPVVAVALALVLGTALTTVAVRRPGGAAPPGAPAASAPAPAPSAPGSTTGPPAPADLRAALEERLLVPPGTAARLPDEENGLGPLDASGVLALSGGSEQDRAEAARGLERLGFQAAMARGWTAEGRVYVLLVYRFASPEGAAGLVSGLATRLPGPPLETEAAPGAVAYTGRSERYFEQHASFARGPYAYELTYLTPQEDRDHRRFERLLRRQAAHAARLDP